MKNILKIQDLEMQIENLEKKADASKEKKQYEQVKKNRRVLIDNINTLEQNAGVLAKQVEQINKKYEQLSLKIDIAEPDEQAGYYERRFANDAKTDALNAKWKGYHKISIPTNESEEFIKTNFKRFTTAVEKSNPGYVWNWQENTLVGKTFGGIFGLEEFKNDKDEVIAFARIRYVRSVENIDKADIPDVKLVNKEFMPYDDYMEQKEAQKKSKETGTTGNVATASSSAFEDSDDLPF